LKTVCLTDEQTSFLLDILSHDGDMLAQVIDGANDSHFASTPTLVGEYANRIAYALVAAVDSREMKEVLPGVFVKQVPPNHDEWNPEMILLLAQEEYDAAVSSCGVSAYVVTETPDDPSLNANWVGWAASPVDALSRFTKYQPAKTSSACSRSWMFTALPSGLAQRSRTRRSSLSRSTVFPGQISSKNGLCVTAPRFSCRESVRWHRLTPNAPRSLRADGTNREAPRSERMGAPFGRIPGSRSGFRDGRVGCREPSAP
jgi:hypothetical protein